MMVRVWNDMGEIGVRKVEPLATVIKTYHGSQRTDYWYGLLLSIYGMAVMLAECSFD